jgi:hypothetical protein
MTTLLQSAAGNTPDELHVATATGYIPGWEIFRKFGMNDAVASGTEEMWSPGTVRVLPTSGGALSIVSSSTADDSAAAGTGAWTIRVEGLDSNYLEIEETIVLDGQVAVASVGTDWFRVNRAYNVTAGTAAINAGNISISIGGALQAYIEALEGQTQQTHFTVPANKTVIVDNFTMGVGRMSGNVDLHIKSLIKLYGTDTAWRAISEVWLFNGETYANNAGATLIPEKTEVKQQVIGTVSTQVFAVWGGYLVSNERLPNNVNT